MLYLLKICAKAAMTAFLIFAIALLALRFTAVPGSSCWDLSAYPFVAKLLCPDDSHEMPSEIAIKPSEKTNIGQESNPFERTATVSIDKRHGTRFARKKLRRKTALISREQPSDGINITILND